MTDKIPPRPKYIPGRDIDGRPMSDLWDHTGDAAEDYEKMCDLADHEHGVAKVAVEALRDRSMCSMGPYRGAECQCIRCEALRQIEESGWTP